MSNYSKHPDRTKRVKTSGITLNNTMVYTEDGKTNVKHFQTVIVSFDEKIVTLRNNGYLTYTTKLRLNQTASEFGLPFDVFQKNRQWFITSPAYAKPVPFFDGMQLDRETGEIVNPDDCPDVLPQTAKRNNKNIWFAMLTGKPNTQTVKQSELTADCFRVQIDGLNACNGNPFLNIPGCEYKNTDECGGLAIIEKIEKNQFPKNGIGKLEN